MEQGELPNFKKLREAGSYSRLGTSLPGRVSGRLVLLSDRLQSR